MTSAESKYNRERGQGMVEFALLLPVLMLILMGFFDFGRVIYADSVVANCAREGARFGITFPEDPADIVTVVQNAAIGLDVAKLTINISYPDSDTIQVQVNYDFDLITPLMADLVSGGGPLILSTTTTMYSRYEQ